MVITFVVGFATGPGSIPWFFVTELFTQGARGMATSVAVVTNWTANFLVGLGFTPLMVIHILEKKKHSNFNSFSFFTVGDWTLCFHYFHRFANLLYWLRLVQSPRNQEQNHRRNYCTIQTKSLIQKWKNLPKSISKTFPPPLRKETILNNTDETF